MGQDCFVWGRRRKFLELGSASEGQTPLHCQGRNAQREPPLCDGRDQSLFTQLVFPQPVTRVLVCALQDLSRLSNRQHDCQRINGRGYKSTSLIELLGWL